MSVLIGLLIIALGSIAQASSYVPINKLKNWSWETFWLMQGLFAWLVFPLLGSLIAIPEGESLINLYMSVGDDIWKCVGYGILWGVGGLTFGLSMRYLGVALGQSLALGTCSAFGTIIPAIVNKDSLFDANGLVLLISVSIAIAGIAVIGYAGTLKTKDLTQQQKHNAIKDFALKKGIIIAILAGVMSGCFNLGLSAGMEIKVRLLSLGGNELLATNPIILLITLGGLFTNAAYCIYQNIKNSTITDYKNTEVSVWINNLMFCALAGLLWYMQFFGLGIGQSFFEPDSVMMSFSWSILMSLNVIFSNVWGIILKEWSGCKKPTIIVLFLGLVLLVLSIIYPQLY